MQKATLRALSAALTTAYVHLQARATHGAWHGTWYFEVRIARLGETGHCRLGWSTRKGELQAPVGYDMYRRAGAAAPCLAPHSCKLCLRSV